MPEPDKHRPDPNAPMRLKDIIPIAFSARRDYTCWTSP